MGWFTAVRARATVAGEIEGLLERLGRISSFRASVPMVASAALGRRAQAAMDRHLADVKTELRAAATAFLHWLQDGPGRDAPPHEAQRRAVTLRLRFNVLLTDLDMFADAVGQRSESRAGTWLAGMDRLAEDGLRVPGRYFEPPPVVCYFDRGIGAAIRRTRTRLATGRANPVAIVQMPRERLVSSALAASLLHEVGHQVAAELELVEHLRERVIGPVRGAENPWRFFRRWMSEILADFWAVARLGVGATRGVMGVLGLPRAIAFRTPLDDPHPGPWIRVKIGAALGQRLYPHPQWAMLLTLWDALYPLRGLPPRQEQRLLRLVAALPELAGVIADARPPRLFGRTLGELAATAPSPDELRAVFQHWSHRPDTFGDLSPCLAFASLGQARFDGLVSARREGTLADHLLVAWANRPGPGPTG